MISAIRLQNFLVITKWNFALTKVTTQVLATTILLSVSVYLTMLGISYS